MQQTSPNNGSDSWVFDLEQLRLEHIFTRLLSQNRLAEASKLLKGFLKSFPGTAEGLSMKGRLLRVNSRFQRGDLLIQRAIDQRAREIAESYPDADLLTRMNMFSPVLFLGGRADLFLQVGQAQHQILLDNGLQPHHKVLDVGCGCLRAGHLLIEYLDAGCYFGIEPYVLRTSFGLKHVLTHAQLEKSPTLRHHTDFSFSVFEQKFDFILARSVWTHTSQAQICTMLNEFARSSNERAVFLTSYVRAKNESAVYKDEGWLGRSETSEKGGYAYHSFEWIQQQCEERSLVVEELLEHTLNEQIWLRISHS